MSLLVVGTVAFDAIETPFGKTDKIVGGAATYIGLSASKFYNKINLVSVVGEDFPKTAIEMMRNSQINFCLLYTSPSPRDRTRSRMPSSA